MSDYRYSEADLLDELRRLADELDAAPTFREMNEHGAYNARTYVKRFGGWLDALERAGLEPEDSQVAHTQEVTAEEFVDDVRRVAEELGRPPTTSEYDDRGNYSRGNLPKVAESWDETLEASGLDPDAKPDQEIARAELIEELEIATEAIGRSPTYDEMNAFGRYSVAPFIREFGSWSEAKEEAGVLDTK